MRNLIGQLRPAWSAGAAAGALALAAGSQAAGAQAATIHACVKPKSGATRIVGAKAKCRHGEQRLSWSTTGPRGKTGPPGASGASGAPGVAGANGAGPAFTAGAAEIPLTESPALLLTKTIPPGDYVVTATQLVVAEATAAGKLVNADCYSVDNPGTSLSIGDFGSKTIQDLGFGAWTSPLAQRTPTEFIAVSTITLAGTLESKVTSTLGVICLDVDTSSGVTAKAALAGLIAIQVSSITS